MKSPKTNKPASPQPFAQSRGSHFAPRPFGAAQGHEQEAHRENRTGLPDRLKAGIEHLSGVSLDDVRVHYNSDKPASVGASAYAQGTQIHVGPGQEHTLPHEAWHAVQQKQGRVKVTRKANNKGVNDDPDLETEASAMGYLAGGNETRVHLGNTSKQAEKVSKPQRPTSLINGSQVIQRWPFNRKKAKANRNVITVRPKNTAEESDGKPQTRKASGERAYDASTKANDAVAAIGTGASGVDTSSEVASGAGVLRDLGDVGPALVENALPIASLATGLYGVGENVYRGKVAHDKANIIKKHMPNIQDEKSKILLQRVLDGQKHEVNRRIGRTFLGVGSTGLTAAGIATGVATGGAGLLTAAAVFGALKGGETIYRMWQKHGAKKTAEQHTQMILEAAKNGDKDVLDALRDLGVQTENLKDPKVWKKAMEEFRPLMVKANSLSSNKIYPMNNQ